MSSKDYLLQTIELVKMQLQLDNQHDNDHIPALLMKLNFVADLVRKGDIKNLIQMISVIATVSDVQIDEGNH